MCGWHACAPCLPVVHLDARPPVDPMVLFLGLSLPCDVMFTAFHALSAMLLRRSLVVCPSVRLLVLWGKIIILLGIPQRIR